MNRFARIGAVLIGAAWCAAVRADPKPNIICILADDLGYGDVHALNPLRGKIPTPNLDRLAREGMVFTDAHGGSSVCTPARYGLLTGRYAWRTRLQKGVIDGFKPPLIAAGRLTLPQLLRSQGYRTAAIGKWHLGFTLAGGRTYARLPVGSAGPGLGIRTPDGPITRGFDYFYGVEHARTLGSFFEQDRVVAIIPPVEALGTLTRRAVDYIAAQADSGRPFFLYFALTSPHTPIVPSPAWTGRSGLGPYGDFVMETDAAVGAILDTLDRRGLARHTLVFAASDNGFSPKAVPEPLERQGHFPSARFRGYKSDIWDGGHRIPFIARWPGRIQAGAASNQLVCLTDLMATCADLLGSTLPPDAGEDSTSLLPALLGRDGDMRATIVHHSVSGQFAIRQGPWKLELCPGSGGWGSPSDQDARAQGLPSVQLYDLARDVGETRNVAAAHPQIVAQLIKLLQHDVAAGRSTPGPPQPNDAAIEIFKDSRLP
jgi:arylsulfatase A-like enzyme